MMRVVTELGGLEAAMAPLRHSGTVALVATMGALHAGHMALIEQARREADAVVVSIYVNPRQFGAGEDFDRYPRRLEEDRRRCAEAGVDLLFAPDTLYGADGPRVSLVVVPALTDCLCGASRPGHFDGVVTVVAILFHLLRPDVALFGEKDWQQLQVIRAMVRDLYFPLRVVAVPTAREASGLAMSSRNLNLSEAGRARAAALFAALSAMRRRVAAGERDCRRLEASALAVLHEAGLEVEYLEIRDGGTLRPVARVAAGSRVFAAVRVDGVRLIDNVGLV